MWKEIWRRRVESPAPSFTFFPSASFVLFLFSILFFSRFAFFLCRALKIAFTLLHATTWSFYSSRSLFFISQSFFFLPFLIFFFSSCLFGFLSPLFLIFVLSLCLSFSLCFSPDFYLSLSLSVTLAFFLSFSLFSSSSFFLSSVYSFYISSSDPFFACFLLSFPFIFFLVGEIFYFYFPLDGVFILEFTLSLILFLFPLR